MRVSLTDGPEPLKENDLRTAGFVIEIFGEDLVSAWWIITLFRVYLSKINWLNCRIPGHFGPPHLHVSGGFEDRGITQ